MTLTEMFRFLTGALIISLFILSVFQCAQDLS